MLAWGEQHHPGGLTAEGERHEASLGAVRIGRLSANARHGGGNLVDACYNRSVALSGSLLLRRGVMRRCPVCGQGHLFRRWFIMEPVCPGCGFVFRRAPGHWLGSWFLNVLVVQSVLVAGISLVVALTWPARLNVWSIGLVVAVALSMPALFFPFSRTLWTAIDLVMRPLDFHDGVDPGVELSQLPATGLRHRGRPWDKTRSSSESRGRHDQRDSGGAG